MVKTSSYICLKKCLMVQSLILMFNEDVKWSKQDICLKKCLKV